MQEAGQSFASLPPPVTQLSKDNVFQAAKQLAQKQTSLPSISKGQAARGGEKEDEKEGLSMTEAQEMQGGMKKPEAKECSVPM